MKKTLVANEVVADMNITLLIVSGGKTFVPFNAREEQFLMMITERMIKKNNWNVDGDNGQEI